MAIKDKKVVVDWVDSGSKSGWIGSDECKVEICPCQTTGYLVAKNEKGICVALSKTTEEGYKPYSDLMSIPLVSIKKIRVIKEVKKGR